MEYSINDLIEKMFDEAYSLKIEELLKSDKIEIAEKINTMNEKIFNFGSQELIQDFEQLCNDIKDYNFKTTEIHFIEGFKAGINFIMDCRNNSTE
ncbi:MAG: hypothetical protein E6415_08620 [Intestinibacter bartlettii]|uniref:hypothetical protein n=1 Tax=Intestinibacter bartlettii TaxID=261299 RepID=UPI00290B3E0C|nr:hypothetical protein [Intestinibacter bartlettii]MDU6823347.1 hypothetical protein [Intestinibacter bartlettii]